MTTKYDHYRTLAFELQDRILTVFFNRPEKLNVFTLEMEREVCQFLHDGATDKDFDVVILTGRIPFGQVPQYYSLIDVAVFPRQGIAVTEIVSPLKPFEAMAMGKPVIASNVAALAEIVTPGETGWLFQKNDVQALVQELAQRVFVLDWGRLIAQGTPQEVAANEEVVRVYLGSTAVQEEAVREHLPRPCRRLGVETRGLGPFEAGASTRLDPVIRPARMPRMEELPVPAQRQVEDPEGEKAQGGAAGARILPTSVVQLPDRLPAPVAHGDVRQTGRVADQQSDARIVGAGWKHLEGSGVVGDGAVDGSGGVDDIGVGQAAIGHAAGELRERPDVGDAAIDDAGGVVVQNPGVGDHRPRGQRSAVADGAQRRIRNRAGA